MALIICPNCGKSVSSTAETCIHCGYKLDKPDVRNYKSLNSSETVALQNEFNTLNPEISEYEKEAAENTACFSKYLRVANIMIWVGLFAIAGCIWAFFALSKNSEVLSANFSEKPITYLPLVTFILGAGCWFGQLMLGIVRLLLIKQFNNRLAINEIIIMTKYKVWLKEAKNIDYEIK